MLATDPLYDLMVLCRGLLAAIFAVAAATKVSNFGDTRGALVSYGAPPRMARIAAPTLLALELLVAIALLSASCARLGAGAALLLLLVFAVVIADGLRRGRDGGCGCFGNLSANTLPLIALLRAIGLAGIAAFVLVLHVEGAPAFGAWLFSLPTPRQLGVLGSLTVAVTLVTATDHWRAHHGPVPVPAASISPEPIAPASIAEVPSVVATGPADMESPSPPPTLAPVPHCVPCGR